MVKKHFDPDMVSIIIPTYNSERFIQRTVDSALRQTYSNLEIIIVDDCSQDSTRAIIETLSRKDSRISVILHEKNQGAAVARNTGIQNAHGKYIAFLDSDDLWVSEKIEKQLEVIKEGHPFVFCAYDVVNEDGKRIGNKTKIKTKISYNNLLTKTYISTPTVIYDREYFGNPEMPLRRTGQDYAFWLLLLSGSDAYGIDDVLVHVMRREGSLSKNKLQNLVDIYEVQTQFQKIGKLQAGINTLRYFLFALNKRLTQKYRIN